MFIVVLISDRTQNSTFLNLWVQIMSFKTTFKKDILMIW